MTAGHQAVFWPRAGHSRASRELRPDLVLAHIRKLLAVPSLTGMARTSVRDMIHVSDVGAS
jgi:hypothetical protein